MKLIRLALLSLLVLAAATLAPHSALAGGPVVSGSTMAGSVAGPTFSESWTFSGTVGQRVLITAVTSSGLLNTDIVLKAPGGATETSTTADRLDWQLAATGTYTIMIADVGLNDAGGYAMAFTNVTAGPYTSAGDLDGGPIVSSDVKSGTMSGLADLDAFSFSGTNGDRILIDAVTTAGSLDTWIRLYAPNGINVVSTFAGDRVDYQLTSTGTFVLVVEDNGNDTPGSYSLSLINVTAGPFSNAGDPDAGTILSNQIRTGTFQQGVDFDAYTFSGTNGNAVCVAGLSTGAGTHNTQISLYPPGGGPPIANSTADRFDAILTATGTWVLLIEDSGNNDAGTYTVSLLNVSAGPYTDGSDANGGPIVSSDVKTGTMSGIADFDGYSFSGTNGDRILIDAVTTAGSLDTWIRLYAPNGINVVSTFAGDRVDYQLTSTGTFVLVVEDNGNDTPGSYSLSLINVTAGPFSNAGDPDAGTILSNQIRTGTFQQGVDFDAYTFSGTNGNAVCVAGLSTGAGTHNTQISLYPPGGGPPIANSTADRFDAVLTATGTWVLLIEDSGNNDAGTYTVSLLNVSAGPYTDGSDANGGPIVSSDVKTGTMSGIADFDGYSFSGTNGDRILIDAVTTAGSLDTWIRLYAPNGINVVSTFAGDRVDYQLTSTGTFVLVVEDNGNDTPGSYSLSLINVTAGPFSNAGDPDAGTILSNQIRTGTFQQGVDFDAYTFSGTNGNAVCVAGLSTGAGTHNTQISLYPPGGGPPIANSTADRFDAILTATGTWVLLIEDSGNNDAGTYTVSLLNVSAGPYTDGSDANGGPIVSSDVKTGTMSGIADFDGYSFSGTNGDRILIDAVTTAGSLDTWIRLYAPNGINVVSTFAGDRVDYQLTSTGTFVLVVEDNGNDTPGSYSLSLINVTAGPFSNAGDPDAGTILSNQIRTGTFQQGVDFDAYTFSGTNGNAVCVAGLSTGAGTHNTQISLYPPGGGPPIANSTADRFDAVLTATGTWVLLIEDSGNNDAGTYTVSLLNVSAGPYTDPVDLNGGSIISNEIRPGTSSGIADFDAYTFTGTSGQRILVSAVTTSGALDTWIRLYAPNGVNVVSTFAGDRIDYQLVATGTFVLVVEDNGNDNAGGYSFSYLNVTVGTYTGSGETDGGTIVGGIPRTGSAISAADFDGYTFSGSNGETATITATVTSGAMNTQITLFPPGGGNALVSTTTDTFNQPLTVSGVYTIVIEDAGQDQTGNYQLTLTGSGSATAIPDGPIAPEAPATTALLPASPSPFAGSTRFDFRVAQPGPVQVRIFDVSGAQVRSLLDESLRPGAHAVIWDGRSDGGSQVASGVYYVLLQTSGDVKRQKVVCMR